MLMVLVVLSIIVYISIRKLYNGNIHLPRFLNERRNIQAVRNTNPNECTNSS